jgi:hypothetical protein
MIIISRITEKDYYKDELEYHKYKEWENKKNVNTEEKTAKYSDCNKYLLNIRTLSMEKSCGKIGAGNLYCGLVYEPFCHKSTDDFIVPSTNNNPKFEGTCKCPSGKTYTVAGDEVCQLSVNKSCQGGTPGACGESQPKTNLVVQGYNSAGFMGGTCTCPDGEVYLVGDNSDQCKTLACEGGVSGHCNMFIGLWSFRKVSCGQLA